MCDPVEDASPSSRSRVDGSQLFAAGLLLDSLSLAKVVVLQVPVVYPFCCVKVDGIASSRVSAKPAFSELVGMVISISVSSPSSRS